MSRNRIAKKLQKDIRKAIDINEDKELLNVIDRVNDNHDDRVNDEHPKSVKLYAQFKKARRAGMWMVNPLAGKQYRLQRT